MKPLKELTAMVEVTAVDPSAGPVAGVAETVKYGVGLVKVTVIDVKFEAE